MTTEPGRTATSFAYESDELDVFKEAVTWKSYWSSRLKPLAGDRVIEVGAGIGGSTRYLCGERHTSWLCLDPDPRHVACLQAARARGELPDFCVPACGVLGDLDPAAQADTIFYIDVLEHILDDEAELALAASHLAPGGRIVVLAPAFNRIFSSFDRAVGHHRRYTRADLARLTPAGLTVRAIFHLDSVGFAAALFNRYFLKATIPSRRQVLFWDRCLVPISRVTDRWLGAFFGKTIVFVLTLNDRAHAPAASGRNDSPGPAPGQGSGGAG